MGASSSGKSRTTGKGRKVATKASKVKRKTPRAKKAAKKPAKKAAKKRK